MTPATGFWLWFLRANNAHGITMPWKTIYALPGYEQAEGLRRHEMAHVRQIERDGAVLWTLKVFWYLLKYGYRDSPYEIEARAAERT